MSYLESDDQMFDSINWYLNVNGVKEKFLEQKKHFIGWISAMTCIQYRPIPQLKK